MFEKFVVVMRSGGVIFSEDDDAWEFVWKVICDVWVLKWNECVFVSMCNCGFDYNNLCMFVFV